jgi:hypothetical protein
MDIGLLEGQSQDHVILPYLFLKFTLFLVEGVFCFVSKYPLLLISNDRNKAALIVDRPTRLVFIVLIVLEMEYRRGF